MFDLIGWGVCHWATPLLPMPFAELRVVDGLKWALSVVKIP